MGVRQDHQCTDDHGHTGDVPPHADVVEGRDELNPERIDQTMEEEDQRVGEQDPSSRDQVAVDVGADEEVDRGRKAEVDARGDGHLTDEVEPAGEPTPRRRVPLGKFRGPVIQAARGRVRRTDLRHREADEQRERTHDDPAERHRLGAAGEQREVEGGDPAGQDRDDREADREVGEPTHAAFQLLGVAQLVKPISVGVPGCGCGRGGVVCRHSGPLPS